MAKGAGLAARLAWLCRYFFLYTFPEALALILKYQSLALMSFAQDACKR